MPDAAGLEKLAATVAERVSPEAVVATSYDREQPCLEVRPQDVREVIALLKTEPGLEFNFLASLHGCDYLPSTPRLGVHYELLNMRRVERLRVKTRVEVDEARVPSVIELFPTADFQEREVFDMFGVVFDGHPDMRRILMPEDYEGYPQRRDFAVGGEPVMFTHNEPKSPGWYE